METLKGTLSFLPSPIRVINQKSQPIVLPGSGRTRWEYEILGVLKPSPEESDTRKGLPSRA
jgi:hypothetical protein